MARTSDPIAEELPESEEQTESAGSDTPSEKPPLEPLPELPSAEDGEVTAADGVKEDVDSEAHNDVVTEPDNSDAGEQIDMESVIIEEPGSAMPDPEPEPEPEQKAPVDTPHIEPEEDSSHKESEALAELELVTGKKSNLFEMSSDEYEQSHATVEHDRSEEIPSLLGSGTDEMIDDVEIEAEPEADVESEDEFVSNTSQDVVSERDTGLESLTSTSILGLPDSLQEAVMEIDRGNVMGEQPLNGSEMQKVLNILNESLADTHYISAKIDTVSNDSERLTTQINSISVNYELLAAELEIISSNTSGKKTLSKTVLAIAILLLTTLVLFQVYMFVTLITIQREQNTAGSAVLTNITTLNKKLADYDKNLTKALQQQVHQEEQPHPAPPSGEKGDEHGAHAPSAAPAATGGEHGAHPTVAAAAAPVIPLAEKLNRLRNGQPEKQLVRKESGDWFIYSKKSEECVADPEVIEALNAAYRRIGRSLSPKVPLPAHKALCLLKPDGKGGSQIIMTKDFLP